MRGDFGPSGPAYKLELCSSAHGHLEINIMFERPVLELPVHREQSVRLLGD